MDFDEYLRVIQIEDFVSILGIDGEIFGETKQNISLHTLLKNLQRHKDKFDQAKGACLCLSQDLTDFEDGPMWQIYGLVKNLDTYFIKENPAFKIQKNLYSYSLLLAGL
ncbi:hypothetical protein [Sulfurovum sp. NBC37-1]|uniref:hypothetical protein n=1 Tax=Sulfurovum sp. (strain NBC37-1) TaxID=387093 RepID=UPI00015879BB|nr:hypothetical protein [Sulfurovum sp. NBC37-1]BAF73252.1 hypothetical protein SUN_2315 [Sulfurovum sp. NBC37-1]